MQKQVLAALTLGLGLVVALGSANCVTCPAGQQSCGDAGAAVGAAGAPADDDTCDLLKQMRACMDAFCKTTTNPFCTCHKRGYDLTTDGCKCIDFDAKKFCDKAGDTTGYDCAAASSGVASYCVGVQ